MHSADPADGCDMPVRSYRPLDHAVSARLLPRLRFYGVEMPSHASNWLWSALVRRPVRYGSAGLHDAGRVESVVRPAGMRPGHVKGSARVAPLGGCPGRGRVLRSLLQVGESQYCEMGVGEQRAQTTLVLDHRETLCQNSRASLQQHRTYGYFRRGCRQSVAVGAVSVSYVPHDKLTLREGEHRFTNPTPVGAGYVCRMVR